MRLPSRSQAILALLALLAWAPALASPFWLDDFLQLERAEAVWKDLGALFTGFRFGPADVTPLWLANADWSVYYFRPLVQAFFALDWGIWGDLPAGYHLTNSLLHAIATLLVAAVAARFSRDARTGLIAGAIFAVHPSHQDSVAWITGRTDLIAAIPFLAALLAHLRWREGSKRRAWGLTAVLLLSLAFLAKESAAAFPLLVALLAWLDASPSPWRRRIAASFAAAWPSILVTTAYIALRMATGGFGSPGSAYLSSPTSADFVLVAFWRYFLYLANLVFLIPVEPVVVGPALAARPAVVIALSSTLVLLTWGAHRLVRPSRAVIVGLLFVLVTLLPAIPVVEGQRFLYLPSAGYALALGAALAAWKDRRRWVLAALCGLFISASWVKTAFRDGLVRDTMAPLHALADRREAIRPGDHLYFIDLPPLVCMGFGAAIRHILSMPHIEVTALTLSPELPPSVARWIGSSSAATADAAGSVRLRRDRADRLIVDRPGGEYFATFIERFFLWGETVPREGSLVRSGGLSVEVGARGARGGVRSMAFDLEGGLDSPRNRVFLCSPDGAERVLPADLPLADLPPSNPEELQ
ncbi:MAG: hypothetical protein CME06_17225 [Gemmatimonadetes bacterium]|nr:hypothetical protein [Gemmatimonadota bacterium]